MFVCICELEFRCASVPDRLSCVAVVICGIMDRVSERSCAFVCVY